jgi:hypothetical protein
LCCDISLLASGARGAIVVSSCAPDPRALAALARSSGLGVLRGSAGTVFMARSEMLRARAFVFLAGAAGGAPLLIAAAARRGAVPGWPVDVRAAAGKPTLLMGDAAKQWFQVSAAALFAAADAIDAESASRDDDSEEERCRLQKMCPVALSGALLDYPVIYDVGGFDDAGRLADHCLQGLDLRVLRAGAALAANSEQRSAESADSGAQAFSMPSELVAASSVLHACLSAWRAAVAARAAAARVVNFKITEHAAPRDTLVVV